MTHPDAHPTLLLTDIVDSTALTERVGDARMADLWRRHDRAVRERLDVWRGREIDRTDGFLLLFDAVEDAVGFAVELHRAFAALSAEEGLPFFARVGVHRGPVILIETPEEARVRGAKALELEGLAKPVAARILSLAGPGQTLLSAEARAALGETALRVVSHGSWRLKGVAEPVEVFESGPPDAVFSPPPDHPKAYRVVRQDGGWRAVSEGRHGLPGERDAFIGRERALRALAQALDEGARLVSVLGIGGMGKTRLALRFAWSHLGDYPGGAWFCDLSEARDLSGIASAVARGLDVPLGVADPVEQLGHGIAARGLCLILLDNAEQVLRPTAALVSAWLNRAPMARFLVTSRELLGLPGERRLPLEPMEHEEACTLFLRRATGVGEPPSAEDRAAILALVQLLDDLPLAIELAAARTSLWSPRQILARMGDRFRVLRSGGGRPDRQATLKGALDWSWELLSPDEQSALAQISVFDGGFTVEAAEEVVVLETEAVADALQSLANRSLVRRQGTDRVELLRSVADYAALRLNERGTRAATERRHGLAFAALGSEGAWMAELDNLRAASRRALVRGDAEIAAATALASWAVLELRGPFREGIDRLTETLRLPGLSDLAAGRLRMALGRACWLSGTYDEGLRHLQVALGLARALGESGLEAQVQENLGIGEREGGRMDAAHACFEAALALHRAGGDRAGEGAVLTHQGVLFREQGRLDEAEHAYDAALQIHRQVGNLRGEAVTLGNLANLHRGRARAEAALRCFEATLAIHRALGSRRGEGVTLGNLANLHREQGQVEEAVACMSASLQIAREVGDRRAEAHSLGNLGGLLRSRGRRADAQACFERALAIAREVKGRRLEGVALASLGLLHHELGDLDRAQALLAEAIAVHEEVQNPRLEGITRTYLAHLQMDRGDHRAAADSLDLGERLLRPVGDQEALAGLLCNRVVLAAVLGDQPRAEAVFAEVSAMVEGARRDPDLEAALTRARRAVAG